MGKIGFDNDIYLKMQSEKIKERISAFGGKLYLEFGGKLLTTIMLPECCQASSPTAKSICWPS